MNFGPLEAPIQLVVAVRFHLAAIIDPDNLGMLGALAKTAGILLCLQLRQISGMGPIRKERSRFPRHHRYRCVS